MENSYPSCPPSSPPLSSALLRRTPERDSPASSGSPLVDVNGNSIKQKKLPTVTPRRFNRFFAPRYASKHQQHSSSLNQRHTYSHQQQHTPQTASRSSRMVLGDITASGGNRSSLPASTPTKKRRRGEDYDDLDQEDDIDGDEPYALLTPDNSSPLKRVSRKRAKHEPVSLSHFLDIPSSPPLCPSSPEPTLPVPVKRGKIRNAFAASHRREVGGTAINANVYDYGSSNQGTQWQMDTDRFYSRTQDCHVLESITKPDTTGARQNLTVPFAVAACNNSSVIAVGDEEGNVRILDSEKDTHWKIPDYRQMKHLHVHDNAILGLEFSEDDLRIVTASGDRTAVVTDVCTGQEISVLFGHGQSLRQARFQPGSGSQVVATAGRDGMVCMWDLRNKPTMETMPPGRKTSRTPARMLHAFAEWTRTFVPPTLVYNDSAYASYESKGAERSVTAMSFLTASDPNLILTGSATSSGVCLWDIRNMRTRRQTTSKDALINTAFPNNGDRSKRGVVSIALSGDSSRLYALTKDSILYAYSTAELRNKSGGISALYGFRHVGLHVNSFYAGLSVRPAMGNRCELLAASGAAAGPVVIPTDEKYLSQYGGNVPCSGISLQGVKLYSHGSTLKGGHKQDICDVAFTNEGNLASISDDCIARVWYEDVDGDSMRKFWGSHGFDSTAGGRYTTPHTWTEAPDRKDWRFMDDGEDYEMAEEEDE